VEGSFLASQMSGAILSRERNVDNLLVTSLEANELFFEARNELAGTKNELRIVVGATFERLAVELAEIIDGNAIFVFCLALLGFEGASRRSDALYLLIDFLIGNIDDFTGNGDLGEVLDFDCRQDFVVQRENEIGFAVWNLFGLFLVFRHDDFGLGRRLFVAVSENRARRIVEDFVDDLGREGLAVHLAQMTCRNLARAEAVDLGATARSFEPLRELGFEVL